MDFGTIKNSTPRECQRRLFIDSLYDELQKVAAKASGRNSELLAEANKLLFEDALSQDEAVDMLTMEGFDSRLARQCVESLSLKKAGSDTSLSKFDYCFEDNRGRMFTGRELDNIIEASSVDDAIRQVEDILDEFDPPVSLVSVNEIK